MACDDEDEATSDGTSSQLMEVGRSFDVPQGPSDTSHPTSSGPSEQLANQKRPRSTEVQLGSGWPATKLHRPVMPRCPMNPLTLIAFSGSHRGFNVLLMSQCRPIHYSSSIGTEEEQLRLVSRFKGPFYIP
jgi:hypothetical protein